MVTHSSSFQGPSSLGFPRRGGAGVGIDLVVPRGNVLWGRVGVPPTPTPTHAPETLLAALKAQVPAAGAEGGHILVGPSRVGESEGARAPVDRAGRSGGSPALVELGSGASSLVGAQARFVNAGGGGKSLIILQTISVLSA